MGAPGPWGSCLRNPPGCRKVDDGMFRVCRLTAAAQAGSSSHNTAEKRPCYALMLRAESELSVAGVTMPVQHRET